MLKYNDSFCTIEDKGGNRAFYADMSMNYIEMPLAWAKKAAHLLKQGNYKKGLHYIDLVELNSRRKRGLNHD